MHYVHSWALQTMENFKYLGLEIPSNHRFNKCATRHLEAEKKLIMHLRTFTMVKKFNVGSLRYDLKKRFAMGQ